MSKQEQMPMPEPMPMGRVESFDGVRLVNSSSPGEVLIRAVNSIIRREAARMDLELRLNDGRLVKASVYAVGNTVRVDLKGALS